MDTWITRSQQRWKLPVALLFLPIVGVEITLAALDGRLGGSDEQQGVMILCSMATVVIGFTWAIVSVRCRACGARLLLMAMRDQEVGHWLGWLLHLVVCPVCGDDGTPGRPKGVEGRASGKRA